MELEELKRIWERTDERLSAIERNMSHAGKHPADFSRKTTLQSLEEKYKRFSRFGLLVAVLMLVYCMANILPGEYGRATALVMMAMCAMASVIDYWLYLQLKEINVDIMPVQEVIERSMMCRKRHLQSICLLLPLALAAIGMVVYSSSDPYMRYGAIAGAIFGFAIGLRFLVGFMADYKSLKG